MKAVLFDFFGTLVEYQPDRSQLGSPRAHELAETLGFVGDHDTFVETWDSASIALERASRETLREFSMTDAASAFAEAAGIDISPADAAMLGKVYVDEWARHITPIPGVPDLIRALADRYKIAVVSNTHDPGMVPRMLEEMGITAQISVIVLSVEHGWLKPHPSIYDSALEQLGCSANEAAFVGDSYEADYAEPIAAGFRSFLIDPEGKHDIPPQDRIGSVLEIATLFA